MRSETVRCQVKSIRFFARSVDMIVEPDGLYLELAVPAGAVKGFDQASGQVQVTLDESGLAHVCAAMTDTIESEVRKQQELSVKRG